MILELRCFVIIFFPKKRKCSVNLELIDGFLKGIARPISCKKLSLQMVVKFPCKRVIHVGWHVCRMVADEKRSICSTVCLTCRDSCCLSAASWKVSSKSHVPSATQADVIWGAYHLTEKSGWGVESLMVSNLPVYRRNATSVTV